MIINDDKKTTLFLIIVASLVIFSPVAVKWILVQDTYLSEETYYNLRLVHQFNDNFKAQEDVLQQREYSFNLFHMLFSKINVNVDKLALYLPALLGVLSIILFYFFLKELNLGQNDIFFAIIILATTPVFIYSFTTFSPEILALPIFLGGLILFVRGYYASAFFFGATAFLNIFYTIVGFGLILGDYILSRKNTIIFAVNSAGVLIAVISGIFFFKINYILQFVPLVSGLNGFLIEFGAIKGYALISLGLALIGLFSWWKNEAMRTTILVSALVLIIVSVFIQDVRLIMSLFIAVFAGFSISYLANREWEIFILKGITLLLVFCILFFSAVLALNFQIKNITPKEVSAIGYLSSADKEDTVLSVERNGFLIEYKSGRRAYLDDSSYKFEDYGRRKQIADKIYYSRNLNDLEMLLNQEKITHIMVDTEMKSGEIWNGRYEGLLFFLENSEKFIKIFYDDKIQIYRYIGNINQEI